MIAVPNLRRVTCLWRVSINDLDFEGEVADMIGLFVLDVCIVNLDSHVIIRAGSALEPPAESNICGGQRPQTRTGPGHP